MVKGEILNYTNKIWNKFEKNIKEVEEKPGEDQIHDCRVAMRRLSSIYNVNNSDKKIKKFFKNSRKIFGKSRDIHVCQNHTKSFLNYDFNFANILEFLNIEEAKSTKKLIKKASNFNYDKMKKVKSITLKSIEAADESQYKKELLSQINSHYTDLVNSIIHIEVNDAKTFHTTRIHYKKFRYSLEILNLIENKYDKEIEKCKNHQDSLGLIQDYKILKELIKKLEKKINCSHSFEKEISFINRLEEIKKQNFIDEIYIVNNLWKIEVI